MLEEKADFSEFEGDNDICRRRFRDRGWTKIILHFHKMNLVEEQIAETEDDGGSSWLRKRTVYSRDLRETNCEERREVKRRRTVR